MTLTADTVHNEQRIDNLIAEAISSGIKNLDNVFMYVAKKYSLSNCEGFFFVVEKRFKSLKRRGVISYDRSARVYFVTELEQ